MFTAIYLAILAVIAAAMVWGTREYVKTLKAQRDEAETSDVFDTLAGSIPFPRKEAASE